MDASSFRPCGWRSLLFAQILRGEADAASGEHGGIGGDRPV